MTDVSEAPALEPDEPPTPKPPAIDYQPVPGAEGLPDEVKNGEISPGEDDPNVGHEPVTTE
jgi:hypothetical protein